MNALNINFRFSHVKSSLPVSPLICAILFFSVQPPRSTRSSSDRHHLQTSSLKMASRCYRYSTSRGPNFLNHSASLIRVFESLPHSLTLPWSCQITVFISVRHFQHLHVSPLSSFTPDSKHTFSTNHFHHSSPIIGQPWTDFMVVFLRYILS